MTCFEASAKSHESVEKVFQAVAFKILKIQQQKNLVPVADSQVHNDKNDTKTDGKNNDNNNTDTPCCNIL